ncbi:MAG: iduronate-2-sulfatase [Opitutus sp.]|nr:iduronate-2-sulfatase [Opitutus sp.]
MRLNPSRPLPRPLRISLALVLAVLLPPLAACAQAPVWATAPAAPITPKFNVLFLIADDLNCDLGCYGVPEMKTPNIDRLARRGVKFESAYCQFPLCSPSRSSFLTGRRPNVTGVHLNPSAGRTPVSPHFREKIPDTITLPQLFKRHGIFAARVGKLYHYGVPADIGTSSLDDYYSWDQVVNPRGRDREEHEKIFSIAPNVTAPGASSQFGGTLSWLADDEGEDPDHTDGVGATEAIKLLERFKRESRPFFLAVGFYRPHTPYVSPKHYFDLYPTNKITLPALSADDRARPIAPAWASSQPAQDKLTDDVRRQAIQAYHAATSFMDAQLGRVVDTLDRLGLAQTTVIVFTSDHGYHLGDHGLWQKQSLFERSTRVPLIIAAPGAKGNGRATTSIAEMVDLYPTLAALTGLPAPDYLDGTSLRPILDDPSASVKKAAFSQVRRGTNGDGYSVRSGPWRYTEWIDAAGKLTATQLFDEVADPRETRNLASNPAHATTVKELAALLVPIRAQQ